MSVVVTVAGTIAYVDTAFDAVTVVATTAPVAAIIAATMLDVATAGICCHGIGRYCCCCC